MNIQVIKLKLGCKNREELQAAISRNIEAQKRAIDNKILSYDYKLLMDTLSILYDIQSKL